MCIRDRDEAIDIVRKTCAYTNHTILAEALEKWPIGYLERAVPQLMPIIRQLDNRIRKEVRDESTYIIQDGLVHMANPVSYTHLILSATVRLIPWIMKKYTAECFV